MHSIRLCLLAAVSVTRLNATPPCQDPQWIVAADSSFNDSVSMLLPTGPNSFVAGGSFESVGTLQVNNIAHYNGAKWEALGAGLKGDATVKFPSIWAGAIVSGGDLVIGGQYAIAGTASANNIARWNGVEWSPLGSGVGGSAELGSTIVYGILELPSGDLIAAGRFSKSGVQDINNIARWDGVNWSPLGQGVNKDVGPMLLMPNGDLVVSGIFTQAGGKLANFVARWDGQEWYEFAGGIFTDPTYEYPVVNGLAWLPDGRLLASGRFDAAGGPIGVGVPAKNLAVWDGTAWAEFAGGTSPNGPNALHMRSDGNVLIGGYFTSAGGVTVNNIARWDGTAWHPLDEGVESGVATITSLPSGNILVGGWFKFAGGQSAGHFARFGCPANACCGDCDASGLLNIDDFICFQTLYALSDPKADCDASGGLDIDDFICFQTAYALGC